MTRLEAIGILVCFAVLGVALAWLFYSNLIAKRRVPARAILHGDHVEVYAGPHGLMMPPLTGFPGEHVFFSGRGSPDPFRTMNLVSRSWPWEVDDGELPDFDFPTTPPAPRLFDQFNPRPWAHG